MSGRDDIQFIPDLGPRRQATALGRKAEAQQLQMLEQKKAGLVKQLAKRAAIRKGIIKMRKHRKLARKARLARGMARMAGKAAVSVAARTPWGRIAIGVAIVVGVTVAVGVKLHTGKTLGQLGEEINRTMLGDADDEARAASTTRRQIMDNPYVQMETAVSGNSGYALQMYDRLYVDNLNREKGRSLIEEEIGVPNKADMLIDRMADKLIEAFRGWGGQEIVQEVAVKLENKR